MEICRTCSGTGEINVYGRLPECPSCKGSGWLSMKEFKQSNIDNLSRIQLEIADITKKLDQLEKLKASLVDSDFV